VNEVVVSLLIVIGQTVVIYLFLATALSRMGRSQMATLTPIGYLVIALLGSSVETGLYNGGGSLAAGLVSAATILLVDRITTIVVKRWPRLCRPLLGTPIVLVTHGKIIPAHLRQARVTEEDLQAAVRQRGYGSLEDIRFAVLEVNGSIGVIPRKPADRK
jgi:uncharacterized membrane protein YcaP (DUF421 family)